ncbi:S-formylglutathione hydrolase [Pandoraea captiosa]|nr:S-formylglutathione hydrolase [Pandoraea captiosa]
MLEILSTHRCFGGEQRFYQHQSEQTNCTMRLSVFLPHKALNGGRCATVFYLAGLTCTEETFITKGGAQRLASELGLILVCPDTSPRGVEIPGDRESWDFGVGAGFYVDASESPWSNHYRMYSYIVDELFDTVVAQLPIDVERIGIMGHSMGGHGALVIALRNPEKFRSVSAFAPIANPTNCPWGIKAFGHYLGADQSTWRSYDATELMARSGGAVFQGGILVDQGLDDKFLEEQLLPLRFEEACAKAGQPLTVRRHEGYDHGYYFISTLVDDHLKHHAAQLSV